MIAWSEPVLSVPSDTVGHLSVPVRVARKWHADGGRTLEQQQDIGGQTCPHVVEHHLAEVMQRSAGSMAPNNPAPLHGAGQSRTAAGIELTRTEVSKANATLGPPTATVGAVSGSASTRNQSLLSPPAAAPAFDLRVMSIQPERGVLPVRR